MGDPSKVALDDSLYKTKEIVSAVQVLQKAQDDAERRAKQEIRAHAEAKQRIKTLEEERISHREEFENEMKQHCVSKERLEKEVRFHSKTKDSLKATKDDVANMTLQMDALCTEMEAQRKAFVVNVNWAARCTELKGKLDQSAQDYDQLLEKHVKVKSMMDIALRTQEEVAMKFQATLNAYEAARAEHAKLNEELREKTTIPDDVAAKLAEWEEFKTKEQTAKFSRQGNQKALAVLKRSQAGNDKGLLLAAFQGWSFLAVHEKKQKREKDRAMKEAMKKIANEGMAKVTVCFTEWADDVRREKRAALKKATARLEQANGLAGAGNMTGRQRAIAQLEKQFVGEDKHLMQSCFQGWALGQNARKQKERSHARASRMISNSGKGLLAEVVLLWNDLTEKTRRKKRQKDANMQKATRMLANSARAVQANIVSNWWSWIEKIRIVRKQKAKGTAKAMRMMAASDTALLNVCFDSWAQIRGEHKKKAAGGNKAARMIANSGEALVACAWQGWAKAFKKRSQKDAGHAKALRMIAASDEAMVVAVYVSWASYIRKYRDRNKKINALEKTFGAQDRGTKMVVFTSWQPWAAMEGKKKRAKHFSMKVAIKSITGGQEMLLLHVSLQWARVASISKIDGLGDASTIAEAKLNQAIEAARATMEGGLVLAQDQVGDLERDLKSMKKERDAAVGALEGLESRLEQYTWEREDRDRRIARITKELDRSSRSAKDISEELAKVGVSLNQIPRKSSRSGSRGDGSQSARGSSRPDSGNKPSRPDSGNKPSRPDSGNKLPSIGNGSSRPDSGAKKDGSKSARGVAGERSRPAEADVMYGTQA